MPEKEMKYFYSAIQVNLRKQKGIMLKNIDEHCIFDDTLGINEGLCIYSSRNLMQDQCYYNSTIQLGLLSINNNKKFRKKPILYKYSLPIKLKCQHANVLIESCYNVVLIQTLEGKNNVWVYSG